MKDIPHPDCKELREIVEFLHPDTKIGDLNDDEMRRVYGNKVPLEGDLSDSGQVFALLDPDEKRRLYKIKKKLQNRKISSILRESC